MDLHTEPSFEKPGIPTTQEYIDSLWENHNKILSAKIGIDIYFKRYGTLKYYFSNDFEKLLNAYIEQTGGSVCLTDKITWALVKKPNKDIKNLMDKYSVKYSMTFFMEDKHRTVIFNKRVNNKLYSVNYAVKPSKNETGIFYKRKYTFYYYYGYVCGVIYGFFRYLLPGLVKLIIFRFKEIINLFMDIVIWQ